VEQVIRRHPGEAGIVYCISRKQVDAMTDHLRGLGLAAVPYHAGLGDGERRRNQEAFASEEADIVVATVAFGMGIDRSNLRFVVHAGAPRSVEHYQQEAGRAGRDGLEAECVLIWSGADLKTWELILSGSGELTDAARGHMREIARYASLVTCRHRALVEHFGQSLEEVPCGACDVCLGELEAVEDATLLAQKILSCVARVEQRWGIGQVIDVLRGRSTDRVFAAGHDSLTTFGLLEGMPVAELRGHIEQLLDRGLLERRGRDYPVLQLTDESWPVLRGERDVALYRQRRPTSRAARRTRAEAVSWEGVDAGLFELLRQLRLEIAGERGVAPYVVFHDTSLRDMARIRPSGQDGLLRVYGVGQRKADDLGQRFLEAIADYCAAEGIARDVT
jgi:ATP-dependent DNA helicase RecQ